MDNTGNIAKLGEVAGRPVKLTEPADLITRMILKVKESVNLSFIYTLCLPIKLNKPVQQLGYQWRTLFAGQTINKHINMGKFWLC